MTKNHKIILTTLIFAVAGLVLAMPTRSQIRAYYAGDAITYNDKVVVASTNSGALELFRLDGSELVKFAELRSMSNKEGAAFNDAKLNQEGGSLYVYGVDGFTLYKYNISNLESATLVAKDTNTYWEWYNRVDKFGDSIVTISSKGVKIFNNNLQVVDSYPITNESPYNIRANDTGRYIFNTQKDTLEVFDRKERKIISRISLHDHAVGNRQMYFDSATNLIYVVDDYSAKQFTLNGELKNYFEHLDYPGYDISSSGSDYIYFSNGLGVVKLAKGNMDLVSSRRTGGINGSEGWAMGLKVVANSSGDKVVLFNNSSIVVLNSSLNKLAAVRSGQEAKTVAKEPMYLKLNTISGHPSDIVLLSGGGYLPNENLTIDFAGQKVSAQADAFGRFSKEIAVPGVSKEASYRASMTAQNIRSTTTSITVTDRQDIKVTGASSNTHYNIAFDILDTQIINKR